MFDMSVPWWEFVVRGVVVYLFLLFFLRISGRRQIGQYDPFDLILLLILSNAVQNSMNAGDNSLVGGLISASTLMLCHAALAADAVAAAAWLAAPWASIALVMASPAGAGVCGVPASFWPQAASNAAAMTRAGANWRVRMGMAGLLRRSIGARTSLMNTP